MAKIENGITRIGIILGVILATPGLFGSIYFRDEIEDDLLYFLSLVLLCTPYALSRGISWVIKGFRGL